MSTLKSNIIEPATGTTLTLGAAGDTLTLASDSLQTNLYKDSGANTLFQSDGSGTLSNINSGIAGGGPKLISTQTASSSASLEFTTDIDSTYDSYLFHWVGLSPATNGQSFGFQVSIDGGTTYATNVTSSTTYLNIHYTDNSSVGPSQWAMQANATAIQKISQADSSTVAFANSGFLTLYSPGQGTYVKHFLSRLNGYHSNGGALDFRAGGYFITSAAINAIKFYYVSGNIAAGKIKMYGVI